MKRTVSCALTLCITKFSRNSCIAKIINPYVVNRDIIVAFGTSTKASIEDTASQPELENVHINANSVQHINDTTFERISYFAEQGNMEAQFKLGDFYALGHEIPQSFPTAYQWYTKAAIQGYKKALTRIHNLYQEDTKMHGRGKINSEEHWRPETRLKNRKMILNFAINYYSDQLNHYRSSKQEDPNVQLNLAFLYQHGYGVKKCISWAFEYYALAAEQGNTDAQYNLGHLYQRHTNKKFNYWHAFKWYTKSAHGGNVAAQRSLAYFYLKGLATDMNVETALLWYTKAAEAGDSAAQVILGKLYRKGDCIEKDLSVAVKWYSLAARQGNIVAQNSLTQLHQRGMLEGIELEEDISEYFTEGSMNSRLCTKLSADISKLGESPRLKKLNELARRTLIGDGHAMYEIGLKYLKGDSNFTQDIETGVKWIKNAAIAEHKVAELMIADLYKEGNLIEQDYYKATIWYKKIAKKGDAQAQCNVGIMYNEVLGFRLDPLEAIKWFMRAADQENSDGQYNIGNLRLEGRGIRQDKDEAVKWFLKSAHQRNIQACYELGNVYFRGQYQIEKNTKRGLALMEYAAKNGHSVAQSILGEEYGSESKQHYNLSKSNLYYTMSAGSGEGRAQLKLAIMYVNENDVDTDYIKMYSLFKQARDRGYVYFKKLFETPIRPSFEIDYSKILNMFIEVTNRGVDDLHYNIGSCYEHGVTFNGRSVIDINYASAIEWYSAASKNGDSRAEYRIGIIHEYGKHSEVNINTAIDHYNKAALKGNTDAIYRLGCIYANGQGVTQDLLKAFHLYTKAFSMGNEDAGKELKTRGLHDEEEPSRSLLLYTDPKILVNSATRISMLEKATEEGLTGLQYQLGVVYEEAKNNQKAFEWFSRAAEIGVTDAYFRLGILYEEGRGVEQDYTMAAKMYKKATEKEHEDACYRLGRLYQYGNGVELDYLKSYYFYKKAADMGHVKTSKLLNISLGTRLTSDEDIKLSAQEYQDSLLMCKHVAEHGDTEMQFQVGFAYEHIVSVPNYVEAYKWYSVAAKSSHKKALYHLGLLYEKGLGVSQDYAKANQLYKQANQQNNDDAIYRLGIAYHYGKGIEVDKKKAVEYYTRAAEQGKPEYQCELGRLYEEGELVKKNMLETLKWYTEAYLQGYDTVIPSLSAMYDHEPYEDFFFKKLLRNLTLASCGHYRLNSYYRYSEYGEINTRLGAFYFFGYGVKKDIRKAWQYLLKKYDVIFDTQNKNFAFLRSGILSSSEKSSILNAIERGGPVLRQMDGDQFYTLGKHYLYGLTETDQGKSSKHTIIKKNHTTAFKYIKKAADKKHSEALFQQGIMYHCGYGVEKNIDQGEKCFDSLVNLNPDYVERVAKLYHTHLEMQSFAKALEWYRLLEKRLGEGLDNGDEFKLMGLVQFGMGLLYEYGDGVDQDYQKAFEHYKKLADNNIAAGKLRLGLMYYYGKGVPVDYKEAFNLFLKDDSDVFLGVDLPYVFYLTGLTTKKTSENRVYRTLYDRKIPGENYYYLGLMHKLGQGVLEDKKKARDYFKLAVRNKCTRAVFELL